MRLSWGLVLGVLLASQPLFAAVSEQEAKRLERDLTPAGAERAGNQAGTIPAWEGGLTAPPPGVDYQPGGHHPDPFAGDKPLYTVSAANMAEHKEQLTEGYMALFAAYPDSYFMQVYPTRRSCAFPAHVYQAIKRNAVSSELTNDGNGVTGALMGAPFPIPKSAHEVLWNHELNYRGHTWYRETGSATPTKTGDFNIDISLDQWIFSYSDPAVKNTGDLKNINYYFLKQGISPPSNAGVMTVFNNTLDQVAEGRRVWTYRPGERKVKRAQGIQYDNVVPSSEGIRTSDNFQIFNGATDLYDLELIGKQEKLIPYNLYRFNSPEHQYKDILHKGHLNQELLRYELHRVWVIEATLKPGKKHAIAHKRRLYLDEDSWIAAAADLYDGAGKLVRLQEAHIYNYYEHPLCSTGSDMVMDVAGGRYSIIGLTNQQRPAQFDLELDQEQFSPSGMRRLGVR